MALVVTCAMVVPTISRAQETANPAPKTTERVPKGWNTYSSPQLHVSFAYPNEWRVQDDGGTVNLFPPEEDTTYLSRVEITVQGFELAEGQDLSDWNNRMMELVKMTTPEFERNVRSSEITSDALRQTPSLTQVLHVVNRVENAEHTAGNQTVYLAHGKIVYVLNSYVDSSKIADILSGIAASFQLSPDAPMDLNSLYGATESRLSINEAKALFLEHQALPGECDIECRDAKTASLLFTTEALPEPTLSPEFQEQERLYQDRKDHFEELREQEQASLMVQESPDQTDVSNTQRALPSDWQTPIAATTSIDVLCGSSQHVNAAEFALDVQVANASVRSSMSGRVITSLFDPLPDPNPDNKTSYGHTIVIESTINMANESRVYRHRYAHLQSHAQTPVGTNVGFQQLIAQSGNSGNVGYHLHFHINDNASRPVDASTLLGFRPDLNYPSNNIKCGEILSMNAAPIIIDAVAFTGRVQPRAGDYWFCYGPTTGNYGWINECYLNAVPDNGTGVPINGVVFDPQSPRVYYRARVPRAGTYRIWLCGHGVNPDGDSLHMGSNNYSQTLATDISGYPASWVWRSIRMQGTAPLLQLDAGLQVIDVWMREDGMRYNRILLTTDMNYAPNAVRCTSYP